MWNIRKRVLIYFIISLNTKIKYIYKHTKYIIYETFFSHSEKKYCYPWDPPIVLIFNHGIDVTFLNGRLQSFQVL